MNIDRLTTIAEWLEAGAPHRDGVDGFDMSGWINREAACGTTCCIAGAAVEFFQCGLLDHGDTYYSAGKRLLGLNGANAWNLFSPTSSAASTWDIQKARAFLSGITPAWAARCIRKLIATGAVDWEGTRDSNATTNEVKP